MELMLIVWGISILKPVTAFLGIASFLLIVLTFFMLAMNTEGGDITKKWFVFVMGTSLLCMITAIVLPTEKTAYAMAAAYTAQAIYENPKVQQLSEKAIAVIEQKLDEHLKK